jgi:hypothetical protein
MADSLEDRVRRLEYAMEKLAPRVDCLEGRHVYVVREGWFGEPRTFRRVVYCENCGREIDDGLGPRGEPVVQ